MDQSEESDSCSARSKKRETNISDLPTEILEDIFKEYLFTLSGPELINFHTFGHNFAAIASRHLPKHKLRFNGCYDLNQEDVLRILSSQNEPLRVDIDNCYWFNNSGISRLIATVPLQELHIINFDISYDDVINIIELKLTNLSMQWTTEWVFACKRATDRSGLLWTALKSVKALFKEDKIISDFQTHFLRHCPNLKKIKVKLNKIETSNEVRRYYFRTPELKFLFTKSKNIINVSEFLEFTKKKKNSEMKIINYSYSPNYSSASTYERNVKLSASHIYEFKNLIENKNSFKENKVWGVMPSNKCAKNLLDLAKFLTFYCEKQKHSFIAFDLHKCPNLKLFLPGLSLLTEEMRYITYLDITMPSITLTDKDKESVLESVCKLKCIKNRHSYLKSLLLNAYFISLSAIENVNFERLKDFTIDAIEKTLMWRLTSCCKEISFLKLVGNNNKERKNEYVTDTNLAAISLLKHLLELHLVNILTEGSGESLSIITINCKQLRSLQLKNIDFSDKQKSIEESLKYAEKIREISIYQKIELSEQLVNNLSGCPLLEKLNLEDINASIDQLGYLNNILLTMKSLYVFRLVTTNAIQFPISVIENLAVIVVRKPAFRYLLKNQNKSSSFIFKIAQKNNLIHNLIKLEWPSIHRPIFQYSCSKCY